MGKRYYGAIGYAEWDKSSRGVKKEVITERNYYGDVLQTISKFQDGDNVNPDLTMQNRIRILADPYAYANFSKMRYAVYMGQKFKITSADPTGRPRITISLGGVYNEQKSGKKDSVSDGSGNGP